MKVRKTGLSRSKKKNHQNVQKIEPLRKINTAWDENEPKREKTTVRDLCIQTKPATTPIKVMTPKLEILEEETTVKTKSESPKKTRKDRKPGMRFEFNFI